MMKLYNQNKDKIETYKKGDTVVFNGANMYVKKLTEEQLNSIGLFYIEYRSAPNRRYYTSTLSRDLIGNKFVVGYTAVEKPIDQVKSLMIKDLLEHGDKKEKEAVIDTGLGFYVPATESDLNKFERGSKRGWLEARDLNGMPHNLTKPQMDAIALAIEDNGKLIFDTKWGKFDEIIALPTVADCITYEDTPYDYTVTQEDVDADIEGTLKVGDIITRTRNNVKEW